MCRMWALQQPSHLVYGDVQRGEVVECVNRDGRSGSEGAFHLQRESELVR
jgi:hypothetical protein